MSDEINWDIDSLRMMVVELNRKGIEVKNKVANIFWQFRYQVTPYWEGENYNKVMEFVNEFVHSDGNGGYGTGFKEKTDMVAYDIPRRIEDFVNIQAQVGGGQTFNQNLISAYDSGNSDVWEVPLSLVKKDGARRIVTEKVNQFFIGTTDPSVKGEVELAKTKLNEYLAIFDAYEPYTKGNSAAVTARNDVVEFINEFIQRTDYMLGVVIEVATQEINGIENVDIESIKLAQQGASGQQPPENPDPGSDPSKEDPSGGKAPAGYNWDDDPCHFKGSGSGSGGSGGSGGDKPSNEPSGKDNSGNRGYDWSSDPCHIKPAGVNVPDGYDPYSDPCHILKKSSYVPPVTKPAAAKGYSYDANQDWSTMSDKDKVARGYLEYRSEKLISPSAGDDYLDNNTELTDAQKQEIRDLAGKQSMDYVDNRTGYNKPDYDRTADWSSLSSDQRVAKAYDDPDFVSKLSDSEQAKLSEAQYQSNEHVDYESKDGSPFTANPNNMNDRQKVQWAVDIRKNVLEDTIGKNSEFTLNGEAYWKRTDENLTVEQIAEVDAEVRSWSASRYGSNYGDYGAAYVDPYAGED